ncbi:MAG: putative toxin-antitoxin system toxin component, PIN family [Deltaproteobacteria bacterium]|nr:putative toxin-antitoxin system toxin component, PIN family [Deltaproteobacteria bacterium]
MIKAVFDTNTFVSAMLQPQGTPARLLEMAMTADACPFELYISGQIIEEIGRVLSYPRIKNKYRLSDDRINVFLALIIEACKDIGYVSELFIVTTDPDDSYIVSTALACKADYLVSGDKAHVLPLKKVENTQIVTIREFADLLGQSQ